MIINVIIFIPSIVLIILPTFDLTMLSQNLFSIENDWKSYNQHCQLISEQSRISKSYKSAIYRFERTKRFEHYTVDLLKDFLIRIAVAPRRLRSPYAVVVRLESLFCPKMKGIWAVFCCFNSGFALINNQILIRLFFSMFDLTLTDQLIIHRIYLRGVF